MWPFKGGYFDNAGNLIGSFGSGLTQAFAMRILSDGGLLVADLYDITRFDSSGTLIQTCDITGQDHWFALNQDPDGPLLLKYRN